MWQLCTGGRKKKNTNKILDLWLQRGILLGAISSQELKDVPKKNCQEASLTLHAEEVMTSRCIVQQVPVFILILASSASDCPDLDSG